MLLLAGQLFGLTINRDVSQLSDVRSTLGEHCTRGTYMFILFMLSLLRVTKLQ